MYFEENTMFKHCSWGFFSFQAIGLHLHTKCHHVETLVAWLFWNVGGKLPSLAKPCAVAALFLAYSTLLLHHNHESIGWSNSGSDARLETMSASPTATWDQEHPRQEEDKPGPRHATWKPEKWQFLTQTQPQLSNPHQTRTFSTASLWYHVATCRGVAVGFGFSPSFGTTSRTSTSARFSTNSFTTSSRP